MTDTDKYVLKCFGPAYEPTFPIQGQYVSFYDAEAFDGRGDATFTDNLDRALKFDTKADALAFWHTQSKKRPQRADGKPNRPLTCFHINILSVADARAGRTGFP